MIHQLCVGLARRRTMTRGTLAEFADWLATSTARARRRLAGVASGRQELLFAAAVTLLTWMDGCGIDRLEAVGGSLREGLIVDYLRGRGGRADDGTAHRS